MARYVIRHFADDSTLKARSFNKAVKKSLRAIQKYNGCGLDDNYCRIYPAWDQDCVAAVYDEFVVVNFENHSSKKYPKGWTYFDEEN